ncbi:hypothetical protein HanPSC8_Chr08g0323191 [Helianthus annuus]|nr:hypothetical protein HanPSC8_Chr08g0323191 [Helianthus annuus]
MKNLTDVGNRIQRFSFSSAGISIDSSSVADATLRPCDSLLVIRQEGNIESLVKSVYEGISVWICCNDVFLFDLILVYAIVD